jgi:hypothetical protein
MHDPSRIIGIVLAVVVVAYAVYLLTRDSGNLLAWVSLVIGLAVFGVLLGRRPKW